MFKEFKERLEAEQKEEKERSLRELAERVSFFLKILVVKKYLFFNCKFTQSVWTMTSLHGM